MLSGPGRGPTGIKEQPLFAEPSEKNSLSEENPFSFPTKPEMIQKNQ
jgi:hypothetical protein